MSKSMVTKEKVKEQTEVTDAAEAAGMSEDWLPAFREFVARLRDGEIPSGSRFLVATMRAKVGSKLSDVPIQIAVLPNGKFEILEHGPNTDIIRSYRDAKGKVGLLLSKKFLDIPVYNPEKISKLLQNTDDASALKEIIESAVYPMREAGAVLSKEPPQTLQQEKKFHVTLDASNLPPREKITLVRGLEIRIAMDAARIELIQQRKGFDYKDAERWLYDWYGMENEEEKLTIWKDEIGSLDELKTITDDAILEGQRTAGERYITFGLIEEPAYREFIELLETKKIPQESKFALTTFRGELSEGEVQDKLPIQIVILPNNELKILESSTNAEILKKEIAKRGVAPLTGKMLTLEAGFSVKEMEIPEDLIPKGFIKCKECGTAFEKVGKRVFCSEACRARFHSRKSYRRKIGKRDKGKKSA